MTQNSTPNSSKSAWMMGLALGIVMAAITGIHAVAADGPVIIQTVHGPVQAVERTEAMRSYFAIPFAAPPVGDLRWQPPASMTSWSTPIATIKTAEPCLQTGAHSPFRAKNDREDCLYLDVHTPTDGGPFPVMVWIHGGAFITGDASTYADPGLLVSRGVIVVAFITASAPWASWPILHFAMRRADQATTG